MAEKVTGIVGSQQNRQSTATAARGGRKSSMKKIGVWVVVAAIFIVPALYWWKKSQTEKAGVAQKQSAQSSTVPAPTAQIPSAPATSPQPSVKEGKATWKETMEDGTIPVGVWSQPVEVKPGCSIVFAGGYGVRYVLQYRFYEETWHDPAPGSSPNSSEFRYKALRKGEKELPYTMTCGK